MMVVGVGRSKRAGHVAEWLAMIALVDVIGGEVFFFFCRVNFQRFRCESTEN